MKMKLCESLKLKFKNPDWSRNPELGFIGAILEKHHPQPDEIVSPDIPADTTNSIIIGVAIHREWDR